MSGVKPQQFDYRWLALRLRCTFVGLLVAVVLLNSGCVRGDRTYRRGAAHWLRISTGQGDPTTLNIHLCPSETTSAVAELTQAYLARYDGAGKPVPELVTVIPTKRNGGISRDGRTIVWHLRHGVRWSDGAPFTAADVLFSVKTILNPANDEEQGTAGWNQIATVEAPDRYTAVFHLRRPYGDYLPLFFGTSANEPCVLPEHILGTLPNINTTPYNEKPIGIGPFRVVKWNHGQSIEMEANPFYWRGEPKLKRITWELLSSQQTLAEQVEAGDVDLWPFTPPSYLGRVRALPNARVIFKPSFWTTNLDFIVNRPLVSDHRLREAVRFALDRQRLIDTVIHGYGTRYDGIVIPLDPPRAGDAVPYAPQRATDLLARAGWRLGPDGYRIRNGRRLVLELAYPVYSTELDETVEAIRSQLKAVGIQVETRRYTPSTFFALAQEGGILYAGHFDMTVFPRILMAVSDVIEQYGCGTRPPNGENGTRFCNPGFEQLLNNAELTYDPARQRRLFIKAQGFMIEQAVSNVLYVWKGGFSENKRVSGFDPPPLTPFDDMMNVDVR